MTVRAHGWLVDIIDPKRRSYIDRNTGQDVLTNVPASACTPTSNP
jgi:hypothetical protein